MLGRQSCSPSKVIEIDSTLYFIFCPTSPLRIELKGHIVAYIAAVRNTHETVVGKCCITSWRDGNVQRRRFQGDYATTFLALVSEMECQVRALQMNERI